MPAPVDAQHHDPRQLCLIGFGEAGGILGRDLAATGRFDVAAYDVLADDAACRPGFARKAASGGVRLCATPEEAAAGARIVISAVTCAASRAVAERAGSYLRPGQIFLDVNSVSPETKRGNAAAAERSGGDYVEAAVMAPVPPQRLKVPILLGGRRAGELKALLDPAGMSLEVVGERIGEASAIKMCRSIMIKGLEALAVECFLTARRHGVEDRIVASLDGSYPHMDWERAVGYLTGRVVEHGRRRAAEMREVADTVAETGLAPLMAPATAARQDWVADRVAERPELARIADADWRARLDALAAAAGMARAAG